MVVFPRAEDADPLRDGERFFPGPMRTGNCLRSSAYDSPELSTIEPAESPAEPGKDGVMQFTRAQIGRAKHDPLEVRRARLAPDGRGVFLEIAGLKPVVQMSIRFGFQSAGGMEVKGALVSTIHALGE